MKKANPAVGIIIGGILIFMLLFFAYTIYCVVYRASKESDFAFLAGKTTYINLEDNLEPEYKKNDLIIILQEDFYTMDQVVLYKYQTSYRLGRINKTATGKYYLTDNTTKEDIIIEKENIIGSAYKNIKGVGKIFKILTSTVAMIATVVLLFIYVMFSKEA